MIEHIALITGVQDEADTFLRDQPATRLDSPLGEIRQLDHAATEAQIRECFGVVSDRAIRSALLGELARPAR